jgi:hypothetical protein
MEALSALSVAAATVQFVDFGLKTLTLYRQIRQNEKGATEANAHIEQAITELQEIHKLFKPAVAYQGVARQDVQIIAKARHECDDAANGLLRLLRSLQQSQGRRLVDDLRSAYRTYKAQKQADVLRTRLEGCRERFQHALTVDTRNHILQLLEGQRQHNDFVHNSLLPEVQQMRTESATLHSTKLTAVSSSRADTVQAHQDLSAKLNSMTLDQQAFDKRMEGKLDNAQLSAVQQNFLNSLAFPDMSARNESLNPPATGTYDWILSDEPPSPDVDPVEGELRGKLQRWLTSDEKVFWVSGKAGSGKSSLMSYIESDSRTREYLHQWSRDRTMVIVNFFFWRPGSEHQKSVTGLLRSLLHQLLRRRLPMIDDICAQDATLVYSNWTSARLISTFRKALTLYQDGNHCVFLLIDGLDEYDGDYVELLDVILGVNVLANVKICLSSRPENALQTKLSLYPSIRLENLNYKDIQEFVASKFQAHQCPYLDMVDQVARRAEGIFLWAALVSKDFVDGYAAHDDRDTLWRRLNTLPTGLRPLFTRFFSSIDRHHREFLLSIFHMLKIHRYVDVALATAYLHHKSVTSQHEFFGRCEEVQHQTLSRSRGLIEVDTLIKKQGIFTNGIRGLAREDMSTRIPTQTVLGDADFRSWLKYKSTSFKWLHRSAYDYISGELEADLPAWVQGVDTSLDMFSGCVWLQRYGPSVWTFDNLLDARLYNDLPTHLYRINDIVRSRRKASPDDAYRALDYALSGFSSPDFDRWPRLQPNAQSRVGCAVNHLHYMIFWGYLVRSGFTDYIISRFEWFKRDICAHCVSFDLLAKLVRRPGDTLTALLLDHLISEIHADAPIATAPLPNLHECCAVAIAPKNMRFTISWLSHGKCDEYEAMCRLYELLSLGMAPGSMSPSIASKVNRLSDLWYLSGRVQLLTDRISLQVHSNLNHNLNKNYSATESIPSLRLRFLCLSKTMSPSDHDEIIRSVPSSPATQ